MGSSSRSRGPWASSASSSSSLVSSTDADPAVSAFGHRPADLRVTDREAPAGSGIGLIRAGALLFVVTGLLSTTVEVSDCGGAESTCETLRLAGLTRTRIVVALVVAISLLAVAGWR